MPLTVDDLVAYFQTGAKAPADFRVGIEQEKIGVREDGRAVPYDGPGGIAEILARLETRGFHATREDNHVIALERAGDRITLEPGGQLELSGGVLPNARTCSDALAAHVREVGEIGRALGVRFLGVGYRPFGTLDQVPWLPKRRYAIMRDYLPAHGRSSRLAPNMMKMTATVQANFDYSGEADAVDKMRTAFGVTSIVTALFAASPIVEGHRSPFKSFRAAVWLETDEARCGLLPFVFEPGFSFRHYVEWALDVPMFFVVRAGVFLPAEGLTFRRFLAEGLAGTSATIQDWELHLSTLFPEIRLKKYIEVRGADAGPLSTASGLAALWRGLLADGSSRAAAWALVADRPFAEREALRREVPRLGLGARFGGRRLRDLAVELCKIADAGLVGLAGGQGDRPLLEPLLAYAKAGRCAADDLLDDFHAENGNPRALIRKWELLPDPPRPPTSHPNLAA